MDQDATCHGGMSQPGDFVLDGDPVPPPQTGTTAEFSAHISCGEMARWIKMPLGREVSLSPSDIVLDGDSVPPTPKRVTCS